MSYKDFPDRESAEMFEHAMDREARKDARDNLATRPPHSPIDERLQHIAQLALRIEHFAARIEDAADRLMGPEPQSAEVSGLSPDRDGNITTVYRKLDHIASTLERGLYRLASATDRVDGAI